MAIQITVKDRSHDGSEITIFTKVIYPRNFDHMVELMLEAAGDYPIVHT